MFTPVESNKISTPILDSLLNHPLFWFLGNICFDAIQHQFTTRSLTLNASGRHSIALSVIAETLAASPENKLNEDAFLTLPLGEDKILFAVLDGASSQKKISGLAPHGITGAFYVAYLVKCGFENTLEYQELSQGNNEATAGAVMRRVNTWLRSTMQDIPGVDYNDVLTVPGMAATFVVADALNDEITIAHVADTVGAAVYGDGQVELLTPNQNEHFDRETMDLLQTLAVAYQGNLALALKDPYIKARKKAQLQQSFRRKINQPGACGILNGMPELEVNRLIHEDTIPLTENLQAVILLSDGTLLPFLESGRSAQSALENLIETMFTSDGESILQIGAARLDQDPEFRRIPRLKHRDDATIMEILFSF